jgi:hypothetical protein
MGIASRFNMDGVIDNQPVYAIVSMSLLGDPGIDFVTFCGYLWGEGCRVTNRHGNVALCNPDYLDRITKTWNVPCATCHGGRVIAEEDEEGNMKYATGGMPIIIDCPDCKETNNEQ